jgi:formylmethanofuran dehydrogenase subunit E
MATVEPSASPNEIVRCAACHGRITMPDFVILQGALMCYPCERLQAAETPGRLPEPS